MRRALDRLRGKQRSASTAKERLQLVLIHDRTDLSPAMMEDLQEEIIEVITRYISIDRDAVQITVQQDGREQYLLAEIPIRAAKRRR
ncbi:MAG: cell division topological specificity factor MinE [Anaerolineales bacterium]|nr:cell division topological specificity factor MinE [Anaerolineales bacterium]